MNTKLHAICDSQGRPLNLFVTAGQVSDYIGARVDCPQRVVRVDC
jgi:transposase